MNGILDGGGADLAKVVRALPPEHRARLTFHLPLEVQALEVAGASPEVIRDRIEQRLPAAFGATLVDPPLYRWAEGYYGGHGEALASGGAEARREAFAAVAPLGAGLAGGAFHALIRFGYGALRHDPAEISRGLAYLRARRQVLFAGEPERVAASALSLPGPTELADVSVFDQLDLVAGDPALHASDGPDTPLDAPAQLCATAFALVRRDPGSFIAIHTVTGLHALCEIDHLLTGRDELGELPADGLLAAWWRAMAHAIHACRLLVEAATPGGPTRPALSFTSSAELIAAAIDSCEVHDLKIAVSLGRLVELGVACEDDALRVGEAKLSATECSA